MTIKANDIWLEKLHGEIWGRKVGLFFRHMLAWNASAINVHIHSAYKQPQTLANASISILKNHYGKASIYEYMYFKMRQRTFWICRMYIYTIFIQRFFVTRRTCSTSMTCIWYHCLFVHSFISWFGLFFYIHVATKSWIWRQFSCGKNLKRKNVTERRTYWPRLATVKWPK